MTTARKLYIGFKEAAGPLRGHIERLHAYEQELGWAGVHADDCIWPLTPVTRMIFEEGVPVGVYVGPPSRDPDERCFALAELCTCLKHGLIRISRFRPADLPRAKAAQAEDISATSPR